MRPEHTVRQEWIHSGGMPPPAFPSLVEVLIAAAQKPEPPKRNVLQENKGFGNNNTGHGRCGKCLQLKKKHQFATATGLMCKACKKQSNTRGADTTKRRKKWRRA